MGRTLATAVAEQCPALEALCLGAHAEVLADGVGAAWAGPHVFPRLTSVSWSASPVDATFDATSELYTLLRGRRLTHLRLEPKNEHLVAGIVFGDLFVRRVLKAMPALPAICELLFGEWDEALVRALVDDTAGEVDAVESLHLAQSYQIVGAVEPLGRLANLRELHLRGSSLPPPSAWSALTRLAVLHVGWCGNDAAALVAALAASPVRATLTILTLRSCRVALTFESSAADLLRLTALRLLECTFIFSEDFGGTMGPPGSNAEHMARRRLATWAMRLLPGVVVRVDRFVLDG